MTCGRFSSALPLRPPGTRTCCKRNMANNINILTTTSATVVQSNKYLVHTAAQPSHDWAAGDPHTDFTVNANGTLVLLEATRQFCASAVFIFMSTNKVYGDTPNRLPLLELETRWEIAPGHYYEEGIDESMSVDNSKHSVFGASKVAADIMVQEYGRYFGMKTACFRGGCLTGPAHSGAELHGFLAYLMECTITSKPYTVLGYKGKQVRDNIHSHDLVAAFDEFYRNPRCGEVYNMGGSRHCNCSILETISLCEQIAGKKLNCAYKEENRSGDHIWYISTWENSTAIMRVGNILTTCAEFSRRSTPLR